MGGFGTGAEEIGFWIREWRKENKLRNQEKRRKNIENRE
jgi:hypothetical protein